MPPSARRAHCAEFPPGRADGDLNSEKGATRNDKAPTASRPSMIRPDLLQNDVESSLLSAASTQGRAVDSPLGFACASLSTVYQTCSATQVMAVQHRQVGGRCCRRNNIRFRPCLQTRSRARQPHYCTTDRFDYYGLLLLHSARAHLYPSSALTVPLDKAERVWSWVTNNQRCLDDSSASSRS